MNYILLTKNSNFILKPFAWVLGWIMEGIFWLLDKLGIPNTGLSIILFTIIIYTAMIPLTIKQQKFSKLSAKMSPELQAIQSKYKGKSDQASMEKMQQETQLVYAKYGVNPSGSCVQLLIQMPILFALYRVIYSMPAYVGKIKDAFLPLVDELVRMEGIREGSRELLETFTSYNYYKKQFGNELFGMTSIESGLEYTKNTFIDVLNRASTAEWASIAEKFPDLASKVHETTALLDQYNNFLGLNIANTPSYVFSTQMHAASDERNIMLMIGALMIPLLSALTQWINTKLMPKQETNSNDEENVMVSSMKTMNSIMPLMSAFLCYTLPIGMGIYWISGSVIRSIIQIVVNKQIDRIDIDEMIKKNIEKNNERRQKMGLPAQTINTNATINTKNVDRKESSSEKKGHDVKASTNYYNSNESKPGSLASKAAMVKKYNEKNSK